MARRTPDRARAIPGSPRVLPSSCYCRVFLGMLTPLLRDPYFSISRRSPKWEPEFTRWLLFLWGPRARRCHAPGGLAAGSSPPRGAAGGLACGDRKDPPPSASERNSLKADGLFPHRAASPPAPCDRAGRGARGRPWSQQPWCPHTAGSALTTASSAHPLRLFN